MAVYTYDYDTRYEPAIPTAEIVIGRALSAPGLPVEAIVDTGADATIIPIGYLQQISARKGAKAWLRGPTGARALVDLYQISLRLGPYERARLEVVGDRQHDEVIIGRDVLNDLIMTLNGPGHAVEVMA